MKQTIDILSDAWTKLIGGTFDMDRLSGGLVHDCGVDGLTLTPSDIVDALYSRATSKSAEIGFACAECLACYSASDSLSNEEFLRSLAAMFCLADAIQRGFGDWEFSFDVVLTVLAANRKKDDSMIRMSALACILATTNGTAA